MNYYKKILRYHFKTGEPMPSFMHLLFYNCDGGGVYKNWRWFVKDNIKVFVPWYRRFKKVRRRNYYGFQINQDRVNVIIESIENYFYRKNDYACRRKEFNKMRNKLMQKLLQKQDCCQHCFSTEFLTVDHIMPLIRGGSNNIKNLQILCRSCNSKKGDRI